MGRCGDRMQLRPLEPSPDEAGPAAQVQSHRVAIEAFMETAATRDFGTRKHYGIATWEHGSII
eukprot:9477590-Pyramimonas_sp.AAC.1